MNIICDEMNAESELCQDAETNDITENDNDDRRDDSICSNELIYLKLPF